MLHKFQKNQKMTKFDLKRPSRSLLSNHCDRDQLQ